MKKGKIKFENKINKTEVDNTSSSNSKSRKRASNECKNSTTGDNV